MKPLHIPPNTPLYVALVDPLGVYDFELRVGQYETTTGQLLTLPRPAVVILNLLEPRPGEEIVIQKHWSGTPGAVTEWTISLSNRSECARAEAESGQDLTGALQASIEQAEAQKAAVAPPVPIRKPVKPAPAPEVQPRLFDKGGTGTEGIPLRAVLPYVAPVSLPAAAMHRKTPTVQIPANVAVREILAFIKADPSTANWGDQAVQDLLCTVYIAAVKSGHVGLWERGAE